MRGAGKTNGKDGILHNTESYMERPMGRMEYCITQNVTRKDQWEGWNIA
jgi:hypothetical protein